MASLSFAQDIRPLFRDRDVQMMQRVANLNLSNYEDVHNRAADIYRRLSSGSMPCDRAWPKENIARFKQWMEEGMVP